jgi:WD40 repeat protein
MDVIHIHPPRFRNVTMVSRRRSSRRIILLAGVLALLTLSACGSAQTATPAPITASPPTPTVTLVPQTAPTVEPPTPTPTETPAPVGIGLKDAANLVELRSIDVSSAPIVSVDFSPLNHNVATFGIGRSVDIWDADSGERVHHLGNHADYGIDVAFSPDGTKLVSGGGGSDITIWDATQGKRLAGVQAAPLRVYDVAWSPDGQRFAVVGLASSRMTIFGVGGNKIQEVKTPSGWL